MSNTAVVTAPCGTIEGFQGNESVFTFLNIPFARAKRWQLPELLSPFSETLEAKAYGPAPIQAEPDPFFAKRNGDFLNVPTSEDCLNLNIWTADLKTPKKAVLFWVYGGAYIVGYNYKRLNLPEKLVKAHPELIVVAPNYRLGVLGSLNLSSLDPDGSYKYSNNLALLDLIAALKWTNKNIQAFGGDPDNVTLYGHSAGSNAISHLLVIPEAEDYFQKAICQSSYMTDLGTVALDTSEEISRKFFELAGVSSLEEALKLSTDQILEAQKKLFGFRYGGSKASKLFSPVQDEWTVSKEAFKRLVNGEFKVQALMIGGSEGEYDQMFLKMDEAETKIAVIQKNQDKQVTESDVEQFRSLHPELTPKEAYMTVHNQLGLRLGGEWIGRACCSHIPVYEFAFCLRDPKEGWRALHGAPCNYVFGNLIPEGAPKHLSSQMMDVWAAFATTGDPNTPSIPQWPKYESDGAVMTIGEQWELELEYWKKDFDFWKDRFAENEWM
ncbi:carboxylesterase family protein [Hominifimenecus sp. rT4P-3]|uniref:carboxylesterase family protein n=1 Tax=Hominifimenecus sp. rT4P-3 TaxID=3242979 RepID=UPI003DA3D6D5